ncbi:MAG: polysulfide reductase NrfD [Acidobacteria bacterium]|nr:polysulfide reductase NrfD [Acidobacteriota bacterium]
MEANSATAHQHQEPVLKDVIPVVNPGHNFETVSDKISSIVLRERTPITLIMALGIAFLVMNLLMAALTKLLYQGVGVWGLNTPVGWGLDITTFVWWIGIGHAGTLISAILLLMGQKWRTSINRFAEAMTLFAVACAAIFPLFHTGRPWFAAYWLLPIPNTMALWPQFRSPLMWDVFAISTYGSVSLLFWYVGLIPDLGTMRDRAKNQIVKMIYGMLSMGWRGEARHWARYETIYNLLAGLATPLVVSVHTIVSFDFAVSVIPGWHTTIFPPYFVAGAIFSGFAMVLTLLLPARYLFNLHDFVTMRHIENMAKVMLVTGLMVFYGYNMEAFFGWYCGNEYEFYMIYNRMTGPYWWVYWLLIFCNGVAPQVLWIKKVRQNVYILWGITIIVNIGMWFERFIIVVTSLHRDFMPSVWGMYAPTIWEWMLYAGTIGMFIFLMILFVRALPMIPMFEIKTLLPQSKVRHKE